MGGDGVKRLLDVAVAAAALVALSPVLAVVAVVVRVSLGSPVLFRQQRPGLNGEPFELMKFRTMRDGTGSDEERLTAVGRWLRATSLDELPELVNIVRGDMSLVGPRPLLTEYLPLYSPTQARRHEVRPGLTGLAQVSGRNLVRWEERFALDVDYVDRRSLALDLRILWRTVASVIRRDGIAAEGQATMARFTGTTTSSPSDPVAGTAAIAAVGPAAGSAQGQVA
jgi:lipopolysaccharide/colanic/teichoic acid biosynthesis glycosyltransferase